MYNFHTDPLWETKTPIAQIAEKGSYMKIVRSF